MKTPAAVRADAEIVENRALGGANRLLVLRVPDWPGARPGQFLMLSPGPIASVRRDDPLLPRPMAVFRERRDPLRKPDALGTPDLGKPDPGREPEGMRARERGGGVLVEVLYKVEGRGTTLLAAGRAGELVRVVGPLGRPFSLPEAGSRIVIVGGGTGIASLHGLAAVAAETSRVTVILGARRERDLMARAEFEGLALELAITTEDGSVGEKGVATAPLERALALGDVVRVYSCGPTPMMRRCAEIAALHGVACVVSLENTMACGYGVCLGCAAPRVEGGYALVCRDGPVFDAREIRWDGLP